MRITLSTEEACRESPGLRSRTWSFALLPRARRHGDRTPAAAACLRHYRRARNRHVLGEATAHERRTSLTGQTHEESALLPVYETAGNGFLDSSGVAGLPAQLEHGDDELVVSDDLRDPRAPLDRVVYHKEDVTHVNDLLEQFQRHKIDTVLHLAAIVHPGRDLSRVDEYLVDMEGNRTCSRPAGYRDRPSWSPQRAAYAISRHLPEWWRPRHPRHESFSTLTQGLVN